jgi:hypothetical protein
LHYITKQSRFFGHITLQFEDIIVVSSRQNLRELDLQPWEVILSRGKVGGLEIGGETFCLSQCLKSILDIIDQHLKLVTFTK